MRQKRKTWKKWYWLITFFPITITGFLVYVFYGHKYGSGGIAALSFIMSLSFPICVQIVYFEFKSNKWFEKLVNTLILMMCAGPFVFGLIWTQNKYITYQLEKYPKIAYGQIISFETTRGRGGTNHYATFNYTVDNRILVQKVDNNNSYFKIDDSLKIIVSANDPEIFRIIGVKKITYR